MAAGGWGSWESWEIHDAAGRRKYLNSQERDRFLAAADRYAQPWRALCYVLAYTGCRVSEALALTTHQLDAEEFTITFRTLKKRGVKHRTLPVPAELIAMLLPLATSAGDHFWTIHRGTAWHHVRAILHHAGIDGPMACPKGLRHGFGIRAATRQVPLSLIQRWMGHSSAETTAIYLDAVGAEERDIARRMW